jgi:membrane-bound lytic murein transglycosylase B
MQHFRQKYSILVQSAGLAGLLAVVGCAKAPAPSSAEVAIAPAAMAPAPALPPLPQMGGDAGFQAFIRDFETTAMAAGITPDTYNRAVAGITPVPAIQTVIDNQPEFAKQVWSYLDGTVSARRVANAQVMLTRYAGVLGAIESRSGVSKEILVAIWGMETDYGGSKGEYNLFATLATQAYTGPRQQYARREFLAALKLMQQENYPLSEMVSSWAGAFGQTQFMPSTFFKYATDGDGDGRVDLWASPADALASTAALLAQEGWQTGKPWAYEVKLPKDFDFSVADLDNQKPLSDWAAMGVETATGTRLPSGGDPASLYLPAGARGPAFMLFTNFRVIMKYNNAASYALAVGMLADRMAGGKPFVAKWPRDERALSRAERNQFQNDLKALGYDAGEADGLLGRKTRSALKLYQKSKGIAADGFPTAALLTSLNSAATSSSAANRTGQAADAAPADSGSAAR